MAISFGGMSSGLPPNIVEQLMEAERIPVKMEEEKIQKSQNRLNLVSDLESKLQKIKGALTTLGGSSGFIDRKLTTSDPETLGGTLDPQKSVPGEWTVEVVQTAKASAALSNGFPDKDKTHIGVGYLRFVDADGNQKDVYISKANSTLDGLSASINSSGLGIKASIINDRKDPDAPFRLVLSREDKGVENSVDFPTVYLLDGDQDFYFSEKKEAQNGIIKIDGFESQIAKNSIEDLVPGVKLDILRAQPGKEITIKVQNDVEAIGGKIKDFVDSVNGVLSFIQAQNKLDANSDTTRTLGGDSLLRSIEYRLRNLIQGSVPTPGSIKRLADIGVQFNRNGTLDFDKGKFDGILSRSPDSVHQFLVGDGFKFGFMPSVKSAVDGLLSAPFGPVTNKKNGLQNRIDQSNRRIENKERQLVRREEQLRRQFSKLEETMSRLKSQGQAIGAIGGGGGGIGGIG